MLRPADAAPAKSCRLVSHSERERRSCAVTAGDLPVKPGKRLAESRIGGWTGNDEPAIRIHVNAGDHLFQLNVEILGDGAGDVTLEQKDKSEAGGSQRDQDSDDAAGNQTKPQRLPCHANWRRR
jgi:hypothetical protein